MTATYQRLGVRLLYPENWSVVDEEVDSDFTGAVTLQSPSGAFWSLSIHSGAQRAADLNLRAVRAIQETYEEVEITPVTEEIAGLAASGHDMFFYCLDFVVSAQVRTVLHAGRALVVFCQAEDREFERLAPVFRAITQSLLDSQIDTPPQD